MIKKNIDVFLSSEASITVEKIESNNTFSEVDLSIYKGKDGYTPIKGIDYFTEEDIESLKEIFAFKEKGLSDQGNVRGEFVVYKYIPKVYDRMKRKGIILEDIFGE